LCTNRALCYKNLGLWEKVEDDARKALTHDRFNAKGHYLLGLCLNRRGQWVEGVSQLEKGLEMAKRQELHAPAGQGRKKFGPLIRDMEAAIGSGRNQWHSAHVVEAEEGDRELWAAIDAALVTRERIAASATATGAAADGAGAPVLTAEEERAIGSGPRRGTVRPYIASSTALAEVLSAEERRRDAVAGSHHAAASKCGEGKEGEADVQGEDGGAAAADAWSAGASRGDRVHCVFEDFRSRAGAVLAARRRERTKRDIPEYFLCGITFDVMVDPVCAPSGHSYERLAIEKYITFKAEDPTTRTPLASTQLVPNHALRNAIHDWLQEHPWAHPYLSASAAASAAASGEPAPGSADNE
jgi:hypothetical protein